MKTQTGSIPANVGFSPRGGSVILSPKEIEDAVALQKKQIGYQIQHDGKVPFDFRSWQVLSGPEAQEWINSHDADQKYWTIVSVYEGEIQTPSFV
jgi:hypothetical protein